MGELVDREMGRVVVDGQGYIPAAAGVLVLARDESFRK